MSYLILGANGLIGQQFVQLCSTKGIDYVGTRYSRDAAGYPRVNFQEPDRLIPALERLCPRPRVVINGVNLAGGVNFCENNPHLARNLHVESVKKLADWCAQTGALLVFFSTDYVFDGENPPYREQDKTGPLNLYGRLKLESEQYIQKAMKRYLIVRTTNVYGWDPLTPTPNFLMYLYQTLQEGKSFNAPSFLYGNPTYANDLVRAVSELIDKGQSGVFHVVGSGYINRYDWAIKFCDRVGLEKEKIIRVENPPENLSPKRPLLSNLNTDKVRQIIETPLHGVDEGLELLAGEIKKQG